MNGFGIYIWPGDRKYVGFYVNDQKQGYGKYYWNDGREFNGWWFLNKQFGPGKYFEGNKGKTEIAICDGVEDRQMKYGLWENGKRIRWFAADQVPLVNQGSLDYTEFYELPNSKTETPRGLGFEPPSNFDEQLNMIRTAFPEIDREWP